MALFAWFVRQVGPSEVWGGLKQVGWGFAVIIAVAGVRFAMRATAWLLCLEPPHRLPFTSAFAAVVAGDAVGNLTPLGLFASEPAKAAFVRDRVPLGPAATALAIENILYTLSAALMIAPFLVAYKQPDPEKLSAYECGFNAFDDARMKFDVRFYLVAILFIIFDLEAAFLYPWAVSVVGTGWASWIAMMIFLVELGLGLAYAWKKGALEWE